MRNPGKEAGVLKKSTLLIIKSQSSKTIQNRRPNKSIVAKKTPDDGQIAAEPSENVNTVDNLAKAK